MTLVFLDIESIPDQREGAREAIAETIKPPAAMKKKETIDAWMAGEGKYLGAREALVEETFRKTSFDGGSGELCSIAFAAEHDDVVAIYRGNLSEGDVLQNSFDAIAERVGSRTPYFIGHYIARFDLRFIFQRSVILGIRPPFPLPFQGRHDKDFYDTKIGWGGFQEDIKQDVLCKMLGLKGKPDGIDGSKVWDYYKTGCIHEIAAYNIDDVEQNREIYRRITFNPGPEK